MYFSSVFWETKVKMKSDLKLFKSIVMRHKNSLNVAKDSFRWSGPFKKGQIRLPTQTCRFSEKFPNIYSFFQCKLIGKMVSVYFRK